MMFSAQKNEHQASQVEMVLQQFGPNCDEAVPCDCQPVLLLLMLMLMLMLLLILQAKCRQFFLWHGHETEWPRNF